jgi:hypothetical protein
MTAGACQCGCSPHRVWCPVRPCPCGVWPHRAWCGLGPTGSEDGSIADAASAEYELAMAQAARRRDWPQLHPEDAR